ncbi:carbohydrate ABC transporter membrane protein 2 (CUT1 family) [Kribbella rubisoli]|uniref:Carbohydrate ABC transporter membrane protein 2 (CUT1 family) n=1 Tax=Kribbella rubisoli TaxID=3075929 RepID=A0A4Q7WMN3_9ACTN|nr:carbohydrate ABC transporter permease [Kribbella rubisoli]RZU11387.1 carbohydrate ABC transporter membrane protein 2 (CUT1 family) [Kribbella rubisoli]
MALNTATKIAADPGGDGVGTGRPAPVPRRGRRRSTGEWVADVLVVAVLSVLAIATLYPFLFELTISLSSAGDTQQPGLHILPMHPTVAAWHAVLSSSGILHAYLNTIVRTAAATAITLVLTAMMAYPLAQRTFPHRRVLNFLLLFSLLFSGGFIPLFLLVKNLGLLDSRWSLILPGAVGAMNVILMRNFFQAIPAELIDAARTDGASEMRILFTIVLPLSKPVLAVVGLWTALANWNAWFDALLYINDPHKQVLQMFIRNTVVTQANPILSGTNPGFLDSASTTQSLSAAAVMIATLPIIVLYPFLQKYFARGILLGSVKG